MSEIIKISAVVAVFAVVHSALASLKAKRFAASLIGAGRQKAFYRLFYIAQSFVTFGLVLAYPPHDHPPPHF